MFAGLNPTSFPAGRVVRSYYQQMADSSKIKSHPARLEREMEEIRFRPIVGARRFRDSFVVQHPGLSLFAVGIGLLLWLHLAHGGHLSPIGSAPPEGAERLEFGWWVPVEALGVTALALGLAALLVYAWRRYERGVWIRAEARLRIRDRSRREYLVQRLQPSMLSSDELHALQCMMSDGHIQWACVFGSDDSSALRGAYSLYADEILERIESLPGGKVLFRMPSNVRTIVALPNRKPKDEYNWAAA